MNLRELAMQIRDKIKSGPTCEYGCTNIDAAHVEALASACLDLLETVEFYAQGKHLSEKDYDEVTVSENFTYIVDHVAGKKARECLERIGK